MGCRSSTGLFKCQPGSQTYPSRGDIAFKISSRDPGARTEDLTVSLSYLHNGICSLFPLALDPKIQSAPACLDFPGWIGGSFPLLPSPISTCLQVLGRKQDISSAQPRGHCSLSHAFWVPWPQVAPLTEEEDRGRFGKGNRVRSDQALFKSPDNPEPPDQLVATVPRQEATGPSPSLGGRQQCPPQTGLGLGPGSVERV